jgi:hypothetical protein
MALVSYTSSRLTFKKPVIDGLTFDDRFQINTPFGVFEMSKSDFLSTFANVAASKAYQEGGVYNYSSLPAKALSFRLENGSAVVVHSISRISPYPLSSRFQSCPTPSFDYCFHMQSTTAKKLAAVEEKLAELSGLGKKLKKLEKEVASLSKKIETPKDWRLMVGRLADTKISREAVALGAEIRRKQTKP